MKNKTEPKESCVCDDHPLDFGIWGKWTDKSIQDDFVWLPGSEVVRLPEALRQLQKHLGEKRSKLLDFKMKKMETFGQFRVMMEDFSTIGRQFDKLHELEKYAEVVLRPKR